MHSPTLYYCSTSNHFLIVGSTLFFSKVFDLSEEAPDKVLHRLYCNFEKLKSNGDLIATQIQKSLRLIVRNLLLNF